jgi:hypothetical protein
MERRFRLENAIPVSESESNSDAIRPQGNMHAKYRFLRHSEDNAYQKSAAFG